ncbi:hypothetical protein HY797_03360, partial [Candidatus Falkowbacteria bacterium]|nr:hypothetical protein [Candidatus Falkowbacteria bacterium]
MDKMQSKKRVFLINWDNQRPAVVKVAEDLQNLGYEILYWVAPYKDEIGNNKLKFPQTQFHWHDDAIKLVPPTEIDEAEFPPLGEELIENLYEIESTLAAMKKFYILSKSVLAKKHLFHRLIQYWHGIIKKFKPDIIFFVIYPHSVFDYTIYSLAKFLKIKTIMFEYTGITDRYLLISDFKEGSLALRDEYHKNQNQQYKIEDLSVDLQSYYRWHLDYIAGEIQPELKQVLKSASGINKLFLKSKVVIKSFFDLSFFKKFAGYIAKEIGSNMKKEYERLQTTPDFNKKYIYLPLNFQPECPSSPLGGVFVDKILMIKTLSYCLPENWLIYVKEHPIQWAISSLAYFDFRYKGYYEEIFKIKNVRIMPIGTNSHKLIVNSQAVATVSGTAGMEALWRLKPVLLF